MQHSVRFIYNKPSSNARPMLRDWIGVGVNQRWDIVKHCQQLIIRPEGLRYECTYYDINPIRDMSANTHQLLQESDQEMAEFRQGKAKG